MNFSYTISFSLTPNNLTIYLFNLALFRSKILATLRYIVVKTKLFGPH